MKDGKFVYVGDEAGLGAWEGPVADLGGKFIMPGIIDSHVHVTMGAGYEFADIGERIPCFGKQTILNYMTDYMRNHPGMERLLTAEQEGFSYNRPREVYFRGKKM